MTDWVEHTITILRRLCHEYPKYKIENVEPLARSFEMHWLHVPALATELIASHLQVSLMFAAQLQEVAKRERNKKLALGQKFRCPTCADVFAYPDAVNSHMNMFDHGQPGVVVKQEVIPCEDTEEVGKLLPDRGDLQVPEIVPAREQRGQLGRQNRGQKQKREQKEGPESKGMFDSLSCLEHIVMLLFQQHGVTRRWWGRYSRGGLLRESRDGRRGRPGVRSGNESKNRMGRSCRSRSESKSRKVRCHFQNCL